MDSGICERITKEEGAADISGSAAARRCSAFRFCSGLYPNKELITVHRFVGLDYTMPKLYWAYAFKQWAFR